MPETQTQQMHLTLEDLDRMKAKAEELGFTSTLIFLMDDSEETECCDVCSETIAVELAVISEKLGMHRGDYPKTAKHSHLFNVVSKRGT